MKKRIWSILLGVVLVLAMHSMVMAGGIQAHMGVSLDPDFEKSGANYNLGNAADPYVTDSWVTSSSPFDLYIGSWGGSKFDGYVVMLIAIENEVPSADFESIVLTHNGVSTTLSGSDGSWWAPGTNLIDKGNTSDEVVNGHGVWYDNYYAMYAIGFMEAGETLDNPGVLEMVHVSINGAAEGFKAHFDVFNTSSLDAEANGFVNSYGSVLAVNASSTDTSFTSTFVIPEPTTAILLTSGMFMMGFFRRNRF